jgi:hypothetical protein
MLDAWKSLLMGRKFWLALVALVQTCMFAFTNVPAALWLSIDALLVAVIVTIAWEDAAMKASGTTFAEPGEHGYLNILESLVRSRKVWLAAVGVVQTFIFYYIPAFPQEVWMSINGVIIVVIGAIAWEDAAIKRYT